MKKLLVISILILTLQLSGCGAKDEVDVNQKPVSQTNTSDKDINQSGSGIDDVVDLMDDQDLPVIDTDTVSVGDVVTVGEIIEFEGKKVHILMGDIAQVFEVNQDNIEAFYLNETVSVIKGEDGDYLEAYIHEAFPMTSTNMGLRLEEIKGRVIESSDGSFTLESGDETMVIMNYGSTLVEVGSEVTVKYATSEKENVLVYLFNESTKLSLTVQSIERSEKGEMILSLLDADKGEYRVGTSGALLQVNLSEIQVGDTLDFYHDGIMESWPMQLQLVMIKQQ